MIVAVEDLLSEAVARKIAQATRPDLTIYQVMRKNGHGYIRAKIRELDRTAAKIPVFVLIDLDRPDPCPEWRLENARAVSPSLSRAVERLRTFF